MKTLFAASECAPFVKTGGLADVVSALPGALSAVGVSVKVMLPAYPPLARLVGSGKQVLTLQDRFAGDLRVVAAEAEGIDLLLIDAPQLFDRAGGPYQDADGRDWPDNHSRFSALGLAAAEVARRGIGRGRGRWRPDVLHAHDWQSGLAPARLRFGQAAGTGTVTTIHNIAFQGLFDPGHRVQLGLPESEYRVEGYEYFGRISFLKAGLVYADKITTVSPTYARELLTPEFGMGFEGILASRADDLSGILNGVDLDAWNPGNDPLLAGTYSTDDLTGRHANRKAVAERFGLSISADQPLFCVVSRLTRQKGMDILLEELPQLLARGAGLVVLGTGDADLEAGFREEAARAPGQMGVRIGFDEALAHLLFGGADCILVPSRFEPCGLTQLYGLRYGCLPLVARTGGLADTVIDLNEAAKAVGVATGFQFAPAAASELGAAMARACDAYANRGIWRGMMMRAMQHPVGWEASARSYKAIYEGLCSASGERAK